jgi:hypothetical protein
VRCDLDQADLRTIEENRALALRFIEDVLGGRNPNSFDDLVADDIRVLTVLKPGGAIEGKAEYIRVLGETMSGQFTGYDLIVEDLVATIDARVVARLRRTATHVGEVFGTPASGRRITMHELHLMRFERGKLVELLTGGLNPLEFEMLFAGPIAEAVLKDE